MDLSQLNSRNPEVCRSYIVKKFKSFKGITYSKQRRREKCQDYYVAAGAGDHGQDIIERVYPEIFNIELFDIHAAKARAKQALAKKPERVMMESGDFFAAKSDSKQALINLRNELNRELEAQDYKDDDRYFESLKIRMQVIDVGICDESQFTSEFQQACRSELRTNVAISKKEAEASFDLMSGYTQHAGINFQTRATDWGRINAKLEESFKAGLWASGNAKAKWGALGFSGEAEAAIAVGALLELNGDLTWTRESVGIRLGGKCEAFVGGRAQASAKLSVNARKGFEAAVAAGAFAGVTLSVQGSCAFEYDGTAVVTATGSAGITFGAGAEFTASIKADLFGPTTVNVSGNLTVGIGTSTEFTVAVNFDQMKLASSATFRNLVYWRTIARGYETTLMDVEKKNRFYLKKCIARLDLEIGDTGDFIDSYNKTPMEKRSLLMAV